jgi:hypothetical protein
VTRGIKSKRRIAVVAVIGLCVLGVVGVMQLRSGAGAEPPGKPAVSRAAGRDAHDPRDTPARPRARAPGARDAHSDGEVTISGRVLDLRQQQPVAGVEVAFRCPTGELATTSQRDGTYAIRVPVGTYRAFVRDDTVLSVGRPDAVRLPALPSAETAGVPDEGLMALVVANADTDGVDLSVVRGGVVTGHVVDRSGRPIAGAVVRARSGQFRPTLGTDIAESDASGAFELRVPSGAYDLDAHHARFAGVASALEARVAVEAGKRVQTTLTLTAGCIVTGRVVVHDGTPASDGAIEKQWGGGDLQFAPAGRIEPDGRFRWVTTDEVDVSLRAWPWMSPPSPARRFTCRDGARFDDVVFRLPDNGPDIAGVLVDHAGEPVGFAFVDLAPLDPGGIAQQERTDATGHWEVYNMPPGRYRATAHVEGRGITNQTVVSPRDGVRLELGGTGRLEGTTTRLAKGSFELMLGTCVEATGMIALPQSRRLVSVSGGQFTVDDLPACELSFAVIWQGRTGVDRVVIPSGGVAHFELDLGQPRAKTVHGVVRDGAGKPLAGALVTATPLGAGQAAGQTTSPVTDQAGATTAKTDNAGAYAVKTFSSASLRATAPGVIGFAQVGGANVDSEQVDIIVDDAADAETQD